MQIKPFFFVPPDPEKTSDQPLAIKLC